MFINNLFLYYNYQVKGDIFMAKIKQAKIKQTLFSKFNEDELKQELNKKKESAKQ